MTEIALITAIGPNGIIGVGNKLPWHSKQDFYHFKTITKGYPCIFGDKTFFGLPKYPLKNRVNIVVNQEYKEEGENIVCSAFNTKVEPVEHYYTGSFLKLNSIENAIKTSMNYDKIFICGGAGVYKYCLENNLVNTIYLTKIISPTLQNDSVKNPDRYVFFPIDFNEYFKKDWVRVPFEYKEELPEESEDITVLFQKWIKLKN